MQFSSLLYKHPFLSLVRAFSHAHTHDTGVPLPTALTLFDPFAPSSFLKAQTVYASLDASSFLLPSSLIFQTNAMHCVFDFRFRVTRIGFHLFLT